MHIESDIKLGFKDVMLRPKRSTLSSRSEVSLIRKYKFLNSGTTWEGIPIMAALNMIKAVMTKTNFKPGNTSLVFIKNDLCVSKKC